MALKRLYPEQDTYIVSSSSDLNFGADEILNLGCVDGGLKPSRILIQFSSEEIKNYLTGVSKKYKAILHLNIADVKNLTTNNSIIATTIPQAWLEGIGREGDKMSNQPGATWKYTGLLDDDGNLVEWNTPGGTIFSRYDGEFAIQGSILHIIDGGGSIITSIERIIDGDGANVWDIPGAEGTVRFYGQEIFWNREPLQDFELDITDAVRGWNESPDSGNTGLLLRFGNELECQEYGTCISFYSRDTHTIYRPYLEIRWDDSTYDPGDLQECSDFFGIYSNNLREEYTIGDVAQIDLNSIDRYASRIWSTASIYQNNAVLPENSYWGIKDEYTSEMVVDFSEEYTRVSANGSGSFFILDTSNLEPERYYRLLVQVQKDNQRVIIDNKNIFRISRNGRNS